MVISGKEVAENLQSQLREKVRSFSRRLKLSVVSLSSSSATRQFIGVKKQTGEELGISVDVVIPDVKTTKELSESVAKIVDRSDGVIIQLPVPEMFDLDDVLNTVPATHDVDVLGRSARRLFIEGKSQVLPPVVGAMREVLMQNDVAVKNKNVVVVGEGRLVGAPAAVWFRQQGANVGIANKQTKDLSSLTKDADVVVLGAGVPGLLKPEMVKDGVVVLDAGSGEVGGRVRGDAEPRVSDKASIFTPTPGGIGPIAVTMIFANLLTLWSCTKSRMM